MDVETTTLSAMALMKAGLWPESVNQALGWISGRWDGWARLNQHSGFLGSDQLVLWRVDFDRRHEIQFPRGLGWSLLRRTIMHQDVNNKEETASAHAQKT
jgi:hypothetical protein